MQQLLSKSAIRKKTIQTGGLTLISRGFGLMREMLFTRYLGIADTFWIAYRIPGFFRKIFAEGALSAAFVPSMMHTMRHEDKREANALMTTVCLVFEGLLLLLSLFMLLFARPIIHFMAPGFSPEQIGETIPAMIALLPFAFFISGCALFAGSLQTINHFFIPALGPIIFNVVVIAGLVVGLMWNIPIAAVSYFIVAGGIAQFLSHLFIYVHLKLGFARPTKKTWPIVRTILARFLTSIPGFAMSEVSLFIDNYFASFIPGAVSGVQYANRFMGIPLGVFATAFSTILLPHFSRVGAYAPKRLGFYLLESGKLILWITVPVTLGMAFFARQIFTTLFVSDKFPLEHALNTGNILIFSVAGLFFFSINKILLNIYYARHNMIIPMVVSVVSMAVNIILSAFLVKIMRAPGLALGTTIAAALQTGLSTYCLRECLGISLYGAAFGLFVRRFMIQLSCISGITFLVYTACYYAMSCLSPAMSYFFLQSMGLWLWVGPLSVGSFLLLFYTRPLFKIKLYFLD